MSSTLETLPDEILMIILKYSGDVHTIFRIFLGLNQRLNRVLIDKRLHLLADFLSINTRHVSLADYYNSDVFQEISHQLLCINGTVNEQQLHLYYESLMSFHIREQYKRSGNELELNLLMHKALREQRTNDEMIDVDNEINQIFRNLRNHPINIKDLRRIELLVLKRGARLQCSDEANGPFNFTKAINELLLYDINDTNSTNKEFFHWKTRMFKALIVSNSRLLENQDYYIYTGYPVWYFLFYAIYRGQNVRYCYAHGFSINMECYQAAVDFLFLALQWQRLQFNIAYWTEENLFDILTMMPALESVNRNGIFMKNAQWEILKIITDIYISTGTTSWPNDLNDTFRSILGKLVNKNRVDVILFIYRRLDHVRHFFNQSSNCQIIVEKMTGCKIGRQLFKTLMNEKPLESWVTGRDLVFILLQKKERKLLEELLRLVPFLVHQLDQNGNDPLLYVCLQVGGCRHRIVDFLIRMKSDLQRKNFNGENFFDAIHLERNQGLLEKLNAGEVIDEQTDRET